MNTKEISLVVGTAGHIDHGKTQLVKALTGVDADRLAEEKKRGITIELGFAPLTLPSGRVISLIDVPGHDRFIRQMVSGASGVDAVMLVVAADEGVMPQTREHLDILCLLGIQRGIVVITKKDLVDDEMLQLVIEDVQTLTAGTFLENAPVVPVSSVSGEGIDELKQRLEHLVDTVSPRARSGAYFMPIDRAFPVAGFGTVVTGTAYKGTVNTGDEIEVFPSGLKSRVRSIQVHGKSVDTGYAGQRVAMCLNEIRLEQIQRGDVVCAKGVYQATSCLDVMLKLLDSAPEPLEHWQRVHLHIGTSDVLARISVLDGKSIEPGQTVPAQLVLEEPVVAAIGQRFVVRFFSPLRTIGGGEVLIPYAKRPAGRKHRENERDRLIALSSTRTPDDRAAAVIEYSGHIGLGDLMIRVQERKEDLLPLLERLEQQKKIVRVQVGEGVAFSMSDYTEEVEKLRTAVKEFHSAYPHQKGIAPETLINQVYPEDKRRTGKVILAKAVEQKRFKSEEGVISLPKFVPVDNSAYMEKREKFLTYCRKCGYQLPTIEDLPEAVGMPAKEMNSLLDQLKKNNEAAVLDGTFVLSTELLDPLLEQLRTSAGGFTLAQVRDITGSSRKFVLPILEYLDGRGITRRVGEKRILLKKD
jgi:selenocysteine-specific elongation factor